MFRSKRFLTVFAALCLPAVTAGTLFAQQATESPREEAVRLAGVLKSDAPLYDKAMACRRLALVGDKDAVPALAPLLSDEKLATYARSALEAIPGGEADDALREAAGRVRGDLLVGVLVSIGKRRDAKAVGTLAGLMAADNARIAAVAAREMGHVGTAEAAERLQKALAGASADFRPAVATACLICAGQLLKDGDRDAAVALCDAVRKAGVPEHIALAATRRAIAALGKAGIPLLVEELSAEDEPRFRFAIEAARDLGPEACGALRDAFKKAPAARQAILILALSDIGDESSLPLVLDAARSGAKEVRVEAMADLAEFDDPSAVPVLLHAALDQDQDVATAAKNALAALDSDGINAAIGKMLDGDDRQAVEVAVVLAGERGIASAGPALLKLADGPDAAIRLAAVKSLGSTVSLDGLPKLISMAVATGPAGRQPVAREALRAACARLPRDGCVEKLTGAMAGAPVEVQVALIEQVALVGGPKALDAVVAAARSDNDALQDAATQALGGWMTADVAPKLLELAKSLTSTKYKIRALRGYIRVARQLDMSSDGRLEVCRNALEIADRRDEKLLALDALGRVVSPSALALAAGYLDNADLKEPAARAAVAIAEKLLATSPADAKAALERVVAVTSNPQTAERAKALLARPSAP